MTKRRKRQILFTGWKRKLLYLAICTSAFVLSLFGMLNAQTLDTKGHPVLSVVIGVPCALGVLVFGLLTLLCLVGDPDDLITDEEKELAAAEGEFVKATYYAAHPVTSSYDRKGGIW